MLCLRSIVSQLRNDDNCDSDQMHVHTGVIRPRGVNIGNRRLIEAKMKGYQVRNWIVGEINKRYVI